MKNNKFEYEFIDEFFKDEYFKLDELLSSRALTYWYDVHSENNSSLLDEIESSYEHS